MSGKPQIRLYVPGDYSTTAELGLSRDQAHYLFGVMRRAAGDVVGVFNGTDGEWQAEIIQISRKAVTVQPLKQIRPQERMPDLWLCFAPLKRARLDYLAQKATEMGAAVLQPVVTARTNVKRINLERLRANCIEAAEQCTLTAVPEVREAVKLDHLLENWDPARRLMFCDESITSGPPIRDVLGAFPPGGSWAILTGPEGGFSPEETQLITALPEVVPVSLGPRIMRADTAIVAAMAVWQSILGDWQH